MTDFWGVQVRDADPISMKMQRHAYMKMHSHTYAPAHTRKILA